MNDKGKLKLECSLFTPETVAKCTGGGKPLVVYCHCNSGSRRDAEEALHVLMPHGIMVFALDFAVSVCTCTDLGSICDVCALRPCALLIVPAAATHVPALDLAGHLGAP